MPEENAIIEVLTELEQVDIVVSDTVENVTIVIAETQGPTGSEGPQGPPGYGQHERLIGTQDGSNTVFSSTLDIDSGTEWVRVNGIPQQRPDHYILTGPREVTFAYPPASWWILEIEYGIEE